MVLYGFSKLFGNFSRRGAQLAPPRTIMAELVGEVMSKALEAVAPHAGGCATFEGERWVCVKCPNGEGDYFWDTETGVCVHVHVRVRVHACERVRACACMCAPREARAA